jgi:hypothetical protein
LILKELRTRITGWKGVFEEVRYGFLAPTTGKYQTALEEIEEILAEIGRSISDKEAVRIEMEKSFP